MKLMRLATVAFALAAAMQFYAVLSPAPAAVRVAPRIFAQVSGSACNTVAPGSPSWTGTPHGVCLTWNASTASVAGYKLYRGTVTGGPYTLLNTTLTANLFFNDSTVLTSTTYFYVATAVDASSNESGYSNQVSVTTPATFPTNPPAPTSLAGKDQ